MASGHELESAFLLSSSFFAFLKDVQKNPIVLIQFFSVKCTYWQGRQILNLFCLHEGFLMQRPT